jgi:Thioredoxin
MTFDHYVAYLGTPANLAASRTKTTHRSLVFFRETLERARLTPDQTAVPQWLVARPGGPRNMLVISEDWSSDCRRDVPTFARMAAEAGTQLRIFDRDGQRFSGANVPSPDESPNADLMAQFLNHKHRSPRPGE